MAFLFTDTTKTRREAGFYGNTSIDDTLDITPKIYEAEQIILSFIGQIYALPLSDNTNWADQPAKNLIDNLATSLAAALLMMKQYEGQGGDEFNTANLKYEYIVGNGNDRKGILENIRDGKIKLFDSTQAELAITNAGLSAISGFPNNAENNPSNFKMDTDQDFPNKF